MPLNQAPWDKPAQGSQGNPSSPQPDLVCDPDEASFAYVDAIVAGAKLFNYTKDSTPPAPAPAKAPSPGPAAPMPAPVRTLDPQRAPIQSLLSLHGTPQSLPQRQATATSRLLGSPCSSCTRLLLQRARP